MRAPRINGTLGNLFGILLASQLLTTKQCSHPTAHDPGDASLLLHAFLRVRDEPEGQSEQAEPSTLAGPPALPELPDAPQRPQLELPSQPPRRLKDIVKELRHVWKEHKHEQLARYEPRRARELEGMKQQHRGEREPSKAGSLDDERQAELKEELQTAKYGEAIQLLVRDVMGRELTLKFRSRKRLNVLMHSICHRLALQLNETAFIHEDREILADDTPESFGLEDQDIIELKSMQLEKEQMEALRHQEKQARRDMVAAKEAQAELEKKEKQEETRAVERKERDKKRMAWEKKLKAVKDKADREKNGYIDLQFLDLSEQLLHISVKRSIWLGGTMNLICKRLELPALQTCFFIEATHAQIVARDTADSLGLDMDEIIRVKSCENITDEDVTEWS